MSQRSGTFWHVFGMPLILAVISLIGLVAALLGDDVWDVASWLTLGAVVAVILWCWLRPAASSRQRPR